MNRSVAMVAMVAKVFPAAVDEVRLPPACLVAMGLAAGERVVVEAVRGRLLVTPFFDLQGLHSDLDGIAKDLETIRSRLRLAAGRLPQPVESRDTLEAPELPGLPETVADLGADLLGTLECVLGDDIEPALVKLREAVAATRAHPSTEPEDTQNPSPAAEV